MNEGVWIMVPGHIPPIARFYTMYYNDLAKVN